MATGMQRTFDLAFLAHDKLSTQMRRPNHNLRHIVGHANLVDAIERGIVVALRDRTPPPPRRHNRPSMQSREDSSLQMQEDDDDDLQVIEGQEVADLLVESPSFESRQRGPLQVINEGVEPDSGIDLDDFESRNPRPLQVIDEEVEEVEEFDLDEKLPEDGAFAVHALPENYHPLAPSVHVEHAQPVVSICESASDDDDDDDSSSNSSSSSSNNWDDSDGSNDDADSDSDSSIDSSSPPSDAYSDYNPLTSNPTTTPETKPTALITAHIRISPVPTPPSHNFQQTKPHPNHHPKHLTTISKTAPVSSAGRTPCMARPCWSPWA